MIVLPLCVYLLNATERGSHWRRSRDRIQEPGIRQGIGIGVAKPMIELGHLGQYLICNAGLHR